MKVKSKTTAGMSGVPITRLPGFVDPTPVIPSPWRPFIPMPTGL